MAYRRIIDFHGSNFHAATFQNFLTLMIYLHIPLDFMHTQSCHLWIITAKFLTFSFVINILSKQKKIYQVKVVSCSFCFAKIYFCRHPSCLLSKDLLIFLASFSGWDMNPVGRRVLKQDSALWVPFFL